jgi:transcription elongation factor GreA
MTKEGESSLREELQKLKSVDRNNVVKAIAEAREHGDLKENAEFHAAKEQQGLIESRIRDIESKLANSQIIDVSDIEPTGKIIFGTTIEIKDLKDRNLTSYKIVGEDEADAKLSKISVNSPLARSLIGKSVGDLVNLETPGGKKEFEILSIRHI